MRNFSNFWERMLMEDEPGAGGASADIDQAIVEKNAALFGSPIEPVTISTSPAGTPPVVPPTETEVEKAARVAREAANFKPSSRWDWVKEKNPDFKLPEDLSKDNESAKLDETFAEIYTPKVPPLHPLAAKLNDMANADPEFDFSKLIAAQAQSEVNKNLSDDERIFKSYVDKYGLKTDDNPKGFTTEEINEEISSLKAISKRQMADALREEDSKSSVGFSKEELEAYKTQQSLTQKEAIDKIRTSQEKMFAPFFEEVKIIPDIYGASVSESDHAKYFEGFKEAIKIDDQGNMLLNDVLNDDLTLYKIYVMLQKGEPDFKAATQEKNNEAKKRFVDHLRKRRETIPGSKGGNRPDYDAMGRA